MEPILVNIAAKIGATRYNGGWTKTVTGLDKTKGNGFSILGEFLRGGVQPLQPGLYLDCGIGGSRKNQEHHYHLVELTPTGEVIILQSVDGLSGYTRNKEGGDWAVRLWPAIEAYFARQEDSPAVTFTVAIARSLTDDTKRTCVAVEQKGMPSSFWYHSENPAETIQAILALLRDRGYKVIEEA